MNIDFDETVLRRNSIATKSVEIYQKLVGETFLQNSIGDVLKDLIRSSDDCEVDPSRMVIILILENLYLNYIGNYILSNFLELGILN